MKLQTFGSDAEFFMLDENGVPVSATGYLTGTKEDPVMIETPFGLVGAHYDNVALELASPVYRSVDEFVTGMDMLKTIAIDEASKFGLRVCLTPSMEFGADQLKHPETQRFGCSPDINAWTLFTNTPVTADSTTLRSIGGHIHFGSKWFEANLMNDDETATKEVRQAIFVRLMDIFVAGSFMSKIDKREATTARTTLYGAAGAMRFKDYGPEYRVLSAAWLSSEKLMKAILSLASDAFNVAFDLMDMIEDVDSAFNFAESESWFFNNSDMYDCVRAAINTSDDGAIERLSQLSATHISDQSKDLMADCSSDDLMEVL